MNVVKSAWAAVATHIIHMVQCPLVKCPLLKRPLVKQRLVKNNNDVW
jgi:hypothetical protein